MHLDIPTLMAMGSFISACAGTVLLAAWMQNRSAIVLALWGLSDIVFAAGIVALLLGATLDEAIGTIVGGGLLALAPALTWKAARSFEGKPTPLALLLLGTLVVLPARSIPGLDQIQGPLSLAIGAAYLSAALVTLWLGRDDRLSARWPIIGFTGVHAAILLVGTYSMLAGAVGPDEIPAVISWFGLIHFEHNVYVLGTAVFIFALTKERNEASSRTAARTDPLTGIANRRTFMEDAARLIERCRRENTPVSVMMFDLDRFKVVNDTYGHAVGDAVITRFCEIAAATLRPNDVFGRIGGEEFAVVLPRSGIEAARVRAEQIRSLFANNCRIIENHQVNATVSGGVSVSDDTERTLDALLSYSDTALYQAKREGRNRVNCAGPTTPEAAVSKELRIA
jgi:diguanylate cyclase (GGDEF)-like protein